MSDNKMAVHVMAEMSCLGALLYYINKKNTTLQAEITYLNKRVSNLERIVTSPSPNVQADTPTATPSVAPVVTLAPTPVVSTVTPVTPVTPTVPILDLTPTTPDPSDIIYNDIMSIPTTIEEQDDTTVVTTEEEMDSEINEELKKMNLLQN